jgi:hypothetical protein
MNRNGKIWVWSEQPIAWKVIELSKPIMFFLNKTKDEVHGAS